MNPLDGACIFDLERSARSLRLNRFLNGLIVPTNRKLFLEEPGEAFRKAGLSQEEAAMVARLDWCELMNYGASFFCLEKLARVKGISNPEMIACFRGETLEQFLETRKVPSAR